VSSFAQRGAWGPRTTCDPTWRPKMVYIATMMAVLGGYSAGEGLMKAQWRVGGRPLGGLLGEAFRGSERDD
jgi:hypothetical protein